MLTTKEVIFIMRIDVDKMNFKELQALENQIHEAVKQHRVREVLEKVASDAGYILSDVVLKTGAIPNPKPSRVYTPSAPKAKKIADGRAKVLPKFRNPNNQEQTWSGRGRQPQWYLDALQRGVTKEQLAI
jgi:DNA-binding protein H-NS